MIYYSWRYCKNLLKHIDKFGKVSVTVYGRHPAFHENQNVGTISQMTFYTKKQYNFSVQNDVKSITGRFVKANQSSAKYSAS